VGYVGYKSFEYTVIEGIPVLGGKVSLGEHLHLHHGLDDVVPARCLEQVLLVARDRQAEAAGRHEVVDVVGGGEGIQVVVEADHRIQAVALVLGVLRVDVGVYEVWPSLQVHHDVGRCLDYLPFLDRLRDVANCICHIMPIL
jgi:hypothetical protein